MIIGAAGFSTLGLYIRKKRTEARKAAEAGDELTDIMKDWGEDVKEDDDGKKDDGKVDGGKVEFDDGKKEWD